MYNACMYIIFLYLCKKYHRNFQPFKSNDTSKLLLKLYGAPRNIFFLAALTKK